MDYIFYFLKEKSRESIPLVNLVKRSKSGESVSPDNIDIVIGGLPCQDFSLSGKRLGFDSQISYLGKILEKDSPEFEEYVKNYVNRTFLTLI